MGDSVSSFVFVYVCVYVFVSVSVSVCVRELTAKQSSGTPVSRPARICILYLASSSNLKLPASGAKCALAQASQLALLEGRRHGRDAVERLKKTMYTIVIACNEIKLGVLIVEWTRNRTARWAARFAEEQYLECNDPW